MTKSRSAGRSRFGGQHTCLSRLFGLGAHGVGRLIDKPGNTQLSLFLKLIGNIAGCFHRAAGHTRGGACPGFTRVSSCEGSRQHPGKKTVLDGRMLMEKRRFPLQLLIKMKRAASNVHRPKMMVLAGIGLECSASAKPTDRTDADIAKQGSFPDGRSVLRGCR